MYNSDLPTREELPSSRQLLRSTLVALLVATVVLLVAVLPAEYGFDPTGLGRVLGLTEMGEIRQQLAEEAAEDVQAQRTSAPAASAASVPDIESPAYTQSNTDSNSTSSADSQGWREEFTLTFGPAAGDDLKLLLSKGATIEYEWFVDQGHLNSDLHTDDGPDGGSHSYRRGRAETEVAGAFTAVTDGSHGWFWRNRSDSTVTVTLRVRGDYRSVQR